jgi:hypothetical protein
MKLRAGGEVSCRGRRQWIVLRKYPMLYRHAVLGNLEFGSLTLHQWKTSHNKLLRKIQNLPDVFSDSDHCIWKALTCNGTSSWIRLFTHV